MAVSSCARSSAFCFLGVLGPGQPRRLRRAQQLERLAEHRGFDLGLLVALLRLLDEVGDAPLEAVEVGQHQLGLDRLGVGDRVDAALDMGDVAALEAAQDVDDRVDLADVGEELVAEAFALEAPRTRPAMSTNSIWVSISLRRLGDFADLVQPLVGHRDAADVGLDRAERIIRRLRRRGLGQRVEKRRFADIRQADDAAAKAHGLSLEKSLVALSRASGEIEADAEPVALAAARQHFVTEPAFPQ